MRVLVIVVLAGCGRIGFDPSGPPGDGISACPVRDMDVGREHGCLVDSIGGVFCWGHNTKGQVVPAAPAKRLALPAGAVVDEYVASPRRLALRAPATKVGLGKDFSCALLEDASVWCWGRGADGELGDGTMQDGGPFQVALGGVVVDDLDVGAHTSCARVAADRSLLCWGTSQDGELGVAVSSPTPVAVPNSAGISNLDMGHRHNCGTSDDGRMLCWGRGRDDQLGGAPDGPALVTIPGLDPVAHVAASARTTCAVEMDGDVKCFGADIGGKLGDNGQTGQSAMPLRIPLQSDAVEVAMGIEAACARHANGTVTCWGRDPKGDGTFDRGMLPRPSLLSNASKIAMSYRIGCAIDGGLVVCWGSNELGQLGRGGRAIAPSPVAVDLDGAVVLQVGAGEDHVCARTATKVLCWGENYASQIGDGSGLRRTAPVEVQLGFATIDGMAVGSRDSCAWSSGVIKCWGAQNDTPQIGPGSGVISDIAIGVAHGCSLIDAEVACMGDNTNGQLGDGTTTASPTTPLLVNLTGVPTAVAAGRSHSCAIAGGVVSCWGAGGRVGDGTSTQRESPTPIALPAAATRIAAGANSTCAITSVGEVYCWGENGGGELGVGDYAERLSPVLVFLPGAAIEISMTSSTTCARLTTNEVLCWGIGNLGQLGDGLATDSPLPVTVSSLAGSSSVDAGGRGACAIKDGSLMCWGDARMLADRDDSTARPLPVDLGCP